MPDEVILIAERLFVFAILDMAYQRQSVNILYMGSVRSTVFECGLGFAAFPRTE